MTETTKYNDLQIKAVLRFCERLYKVGVKSTALDRLHLAAKMKSPALSIHLKACEDADLYGLMRDAGKAKVTQAWQWLELDLKRLKDCGDVELHSVRKNIKMTPSEARNLIAISKRTGENQNEVIRRLITAAYELEVGK